VEKGTENALRGTLSVHSSIFYLWRPNVARIASLKMAYAQSSMAFPRKNQIQLSTQMEVAAFSMVCPNLSALRAVGQAEGSRT
jgi:hypothetical protein